MRYTRDPEHKLAPVQSFDRLLDLRLGILQWIQYLVQSASFDILHDRHPNGSDVRPIVGPDTALSPTILFVPGVAPSIQKTTV